MGRYSIKQSRHQHRHGLTFTSSISGGEMLCSIEEEPCFECDDAHQDDDEEEEFNLEHALQFPSACLEPTRKVNEQLQSNFIKSVELRSSGPGTNLEDLHGGGFECERNVADEVPLSESRLRKKRTRRLLVNLILTAGCLIGSLVLVLCVLYVVFIGVGATEDDQQKNVAMIQIQDAIIFPPSMTPSASPSSSPQPPSADPTLIPSSKFPSSMPTTHYYSAPRMIPSSSVAPSSFQGDSHDGTASSAFPSTRLKDVPSLAPSYTFRSIPTDMDNNSSKALPHSSPSVVPSSMTIASKNTTSPTLVRAPANGLLKTKMKVNNINKKAEKCKDSSQTFMLNGRPHSCTELVDMPATQMLVCRPNNAAFYICRKTCNRCRQVK